MFAILRHHGIPERIVTAIRTIYTNSKSMVIVDNKNSATFNITTGILQGDVLAPYLFILVIDYVMRRAEEEGKTGFTTHPQQTRRLHGFKINDLISQTTWLSWKSCWNEHNTSCRFTAIWPTKSNLSSTSTRPNG